GVAHHEHAGGDVPGLHAGLEVAVQAPGGHVGQVQGGGTGAAHVLRYGQHLAQAVELGGGAAALARVEAGGDAGAGQVLAFGHADALLVELGAPAAGGGEQLVAQRIEDHPVQRLGTLAQRDRDAPVGEAAQVVAGAVQRIDDPGVAAAAAAALLLAVFLAQHRVVGVGAAQFLHHRRLGQPVHLAGVVHAVLLDHVQGVEPVHVAQQDVAAGAGRLDHDVDGRLLHRRGLRRGGGGRQGERADGPGPPRSLPFAPMNTVPPAERIRIVLVGTQHPGNIGSAARAIRTMGLQRLVLVAPERFPHADATAMAAGADDVLAAATVTGSLAEAVADCGLVLGCTARGRRIALEELSPRAAAGRLLDAAGGGAGVALVFGRERTGLDNEELQLCHAAVKIPADPGYSSLNLAAAVQVLAYELRVGLLER